MESKEATVQFATLVFKYANNNLTACIFQLLDAKTVDPCEGVSTSNDDLLDACLDDKVGTRRCLAVMGTRLKADINGAATQKMFVLDTFDGIHLGMRTATTPMKAFANDASIADNHGSYHRIGRCSSLTTSSQLNAAPHVF
jgi:hypothetical protein